MANTQMKQLSRKDIASIAVAVAKIVRAERDEQVADSEPAPVRAKGKKHSRKHAKQSGFVAWLHDTAEARAERKHDNREMTARIRARKASASEVAKFVASKPTETRASWKAIAQANGYRV